MSFFTNRASQNISMVTWGLNWLCNIIQYWYESSLYILCILYYQESVRGSWKKSCSNFKHTYIQQWVEACVNTDWCNTLKEIYDLYYPWIPFPKLLLGLIKSDAWIVDLIDIRSIVNFFKGLHSDTTIFNTG